MIENHKTRIDKWRYVQIFCVCSGGPQLWPDIHIDCRNVFCLHELTQCELLSYFSFLFENHIHCRKMFFTIVNCINMSFEIILLLWFKFTFWTPWSLVKFFQFYVLWDWGKWAIGCNKCTNKTSKKGSLIIHIEAIHKGIRFLCL